MTELVLACSDPQFISEAQGVAQDLALPFVGLVAPQALDPGQLCLYRSEAGWGLQACGPKAPGPVRVDFSGGSSAHRRHYGGGKGQQIAKAVGAAAKPRVLDATAGLGRDSFVLACLGCRVLMYERSPVVQLLLADGLARGLAYGQENDPELVTILSAMQLTPGDSLQGMASFAEEVRPDVVYLDPMFPERQKSAQVKKEMRLFHALVGADEDADALLEPALALAKYRVVVKRPKLAGDLGGQKPSYRLEGKSGRFDIYTKQKMPGL